MVLIIGPMQSRDLPEILTLEAGTLSAWSREHLQDELAQPAAFQFTARDAGSRMLAVLFGRIMADEAEILKLSVARDAHRQGVGYELLDHAIRHCGAKGVRNCFLELRASNTAARNLYEKRGFFTVGSRRNYYDEPVEDAVLMQLELKKD